MACKKAPLPMFPPAPWTFSCAALGTLGRLATPRLPRVKSVFLRPRSPEPHSVATQPSTTDLTNSLASDKAIGPPLMDSS